MNISSRKLLSLICAIVLLFTCMPSMQVSAASSDETAPNVLYPAIDAWQEEYDWQENSTFKTQDGMIVLKNPTGNHSILTQVVPVKPNTSYRFSAQVRMDNYKTTEDIQSGASVQYGDKDNHVIYEGYYVTTSEWQTSSVIFTTGDETSMQISLTIGGYGATCEGTAYFKDMVLEELETNNTWNVLALIYKNVDTPTFKDSFSDAEVQELKKVLNAFPENVKTFSDSRLLIGAVDIVVIDEPVRSISEESGDLTKGPGEDICFDKYLEGKDYQQIVVYAPIANVSTNDGWLGHGGTWYNYKGRTIYYLSINDVCEMGETRFTLSGRKFGVDTSCLMHEMLHCVETNSSHYRNWSDFTPLHNQADHGYYEHNSQSKYEWMDWYSALMQDDGLDGKGFKPESFLVTHISEEAAYTEWNCPFTDLTKNDGFFNSVCYVYENGLFQGTSGTTFSPNASMTRAMFVTVLGRFSGVDVAQYTDTDFDDVAAGQWYTPYVAWAAENDVVTGYSDKVFGVNDPVTVEQALVVLERYAQFLGIDTTSADIPKDYRFASSVSSWAKSGMNFAVSNAIYIGRDKKLDPKTTATRGMVAEMLMNIAFIID